MKLMGLMAFFRRCLFGGKKNKWVPLTVSEIKETAGEFRANNHPGHFTLCKLVKLRCIADFSDGNRLLKIGQIVHARQVCERGRWHDRVRLRGGSFWIPVEYFKLVEHKKP